MNRYCVYNEETKLWEAHYEISSESFKAYLTIESRYRWLLKLKLRDTAYKGLTLVVYENNRWTK